MNDRSFLVKKISSKSLRYHDDDLEHVMEDPYLSLDDELRAMHLNIKNSFLDDDLQLRKLSHSLDDELRAMHLNIKNGFLDDDL
ncbi:hypothetical protein, partial [Citrobacter koseri]|uniref:hypothetical protein n=1 Tax=Citrobacter koseri TaxID=545 RepID=UPI000A72D095